MFINKKIFFSSLVTCALILPSIALAKPSKEGRFSVGFQSSSPSYGLSTKYELNDTITFQGTLGALGTVTSFGGKVMYKFKKEPKYDIYGYGSLSRWSWSDSFYGDESVIGYGAGAGVEYDIAKDITVNGEIGFQAASFDNYTGFSSFGLGLGVHYWF